LPFGADRLDQQRINSGAIEAYLMNVVIFGKGFGKPRQLNLSGVSVWAVAAVCAGIVSAFGFAGGYWFSTLTGSGVSMTEVAQLSDELQEQRDSIQTIRQGNEDTLDALAIRMAQMNARIIRLDALGRRLTDMADLDDGEFDFDTAPALGGPEEPVATGSNVAIPELVESMAAFDHQLDNREAQLGVLESVLMRQNLKDRVYPQGRPVGSGWISSYFGKRTDPFTGKPANHTGIDFAGKLGDPVAAVADGVVTWSADRYGYGIMVEINHGNGYSTRYAHNAENLVAVGDEVKKGQAVAHMGETGRATGPNLHFEVLKDGRRVNPVNFIREASK
jgi:murein DD-endopeptidase MepM/ murein hydrolase activator NlpD